jgi:hypothetical protein
MQRPTSLSIDFLMLPGRLTTQAIGNGKNEI